MKSIVLTKVELNKYKSYETPQSFLADENVTVLVGKNESGKTAALEAIAKTRYFQKDEKFKFSVVQDYPRREKKKYDKSGEVANVTICHYHLSKELLLTIAAEIGEKTFTATDFSVTTKYDNTAIVSGIQADLPAFLNYFIKTSGVSKKEDAAKIRKLTSLEAIQELRANVTNEHRARQAESTTKAQASGKPPQSLQSPSILPLLDELTKYFPERSEKWIPFNYYVYTTFISPNLPKFLYYDEYYALPSRIDIQKLQAGSLESADQKTSKALFELADININELISSSSFEHYISELEATGNHITQELFGYWKTNAELRVKFALDYRPVDGGHHHILDIRVENLKHMMTLPLANRSKGFNWFFSFFVWFSKIQEDKKSNYVLLLDEPGLNLHASAQADLLRYIEDLSADYQIIYTTHSPFMVDSNTLHRVRTVFDGETGSTISDSIHQRDSDTLFPLQAALGYDIAQNLFISKNNLLVEGPADLIYLTAISSLLQQKGREGLSEGITIIPVGGMDKVVSFISLLKASKLNIACLLDTFTDQAGKQRVQDLIRHKIIREKNIRFFHEFATVGAIADIEDVFEKSEYLEFFNGAFSEHSLIPLEEILKPSDRIIPQINAIIKKDRFNHYRPANYMVTSDKRKSELSEDTLARFGKIFQEINSIFI